jgi:hypothetical protein
LASSGSQTPACPTSSHQLPFPHAASLKQVVPHAPLVRLQNGPACVPTVQSASAVHVVQAPAAEQSGFAVLGQALAPPEPLSPLQATHCLVEGLQIGVLPEHIGQGATFTVMKQAPPRFWALV